MSEWIAEKLADLREIAESASMGRWRVVVDDARNEVRVDAEGARIAWTGGVDEEWAEFDAEHIAAFDPPMVLALLDLIAELEAEVRTLETARRGDLELVRSYRNIADSSDRYRKRQVELTVAQAERAEDAEGERDELAAKLEKVRAHAEALVVENDNAGPTYAMEFLAILDGDCDESR